VVYPSISEAAMVFQTSLQNGSPVIHPAVTLMNAGLLERTGGDFRFYEEGITPSVGRVMEAVDNERLAIATALGVTILSEPELGVVQGYMTKSNYGTGYSRAPGFLGIKAPARIDSRYLTEDVGYTLSSSPTSPGAWTCQPPRWTQSLSSPRLSWAATCARKQPARCARWPWTG
jgi:opine dehydrogenase